MLQNFCLSSHDINNGSYSQDFGANETFLCRTLQKCKVFTDICLHIFLSSFIQNIKLIGCFPCFTMVNVAETEEFLRQVDAKFAGQTPNGPDDPRRLTVGLYKDQAGLVTWANY